MKSDYKKHDVLYSDEMEMFKECYIDDEETEKSIISVDMSYIIHVIINKYKEYDITHIKAIIEVLLLETFTWTGPDFYSLEEVFTSYGYLANYFLDKGIWDDEDHIENNSEERRECIYELWVVVRNHVLTQVNIEKEFNFPTVIPMTWNDNILILGV